MPVEQLNRPAGIVEPALADIEISFRVGPAADRGPADNSEKEDKIVAERRKRKSGRTADGDADGACLLSYFPSTYPNPVQVSTAQTPVQARVNTAAINTGASPVYCNQVLIAVPIGTVVNELFAAYPPPVGSVNTAKWSITSMVVRPARDLGIDGEVDYATFTFDCANQSDFLINYNLIFGVAGRVSLLTGDSTVLIQEQSGTTNDPNSFTTKNCSYTVTAYTPQFYLQNFLASAPAAPTVPASEFANGADIRLSWESNGTYFQVYEKNHPTPIYSGSQTTCTVSGGVATDTTFVLMAMMSGNPGTGSSQGGFAPIYLYEEVTVTVSNPDLKPKTAAVSGTATVGGTLGVTGNTTLTNASLSGTLGVSGQTNLGNASVGGTLGVTGQTNLANAIVGGTLTASGGSTLSNTAVNGTLGVTGAATFNGGLFGTNSPVGIMAGTQSINPGTYRANTDGFVVGFVGSPGSNNGFCHAWVSISTSDGLQARATGGCIGLFKSDWTKCQGHNGNSFTVPVRKGATYSISAQQDQLNENTAPTYFYWIPLGTAAGGDTLEWISDEGPKHVRADTVHRRPLSPEKKVGQLVEVIDLLLGQTLDAAMKKRLLSVLMSLQGEDYVNETFEDREP